MKLYYAPLACSLSDHIALEEAGASYERERVDLRTKRTASGQDFQALSPKGYVPLLVLDSGEILTENVAVLDWIAARYPQLAVAGPLGRARTLEALAYIASEVHHGFSPFWHTGDEAEKAAARERVSARLQLFADGLTHDYLFGDRPSVADFYLFVMLLWARRFEVPVAPALETLRRRLKGRPAVAAAMREEGLTPTEAAA